MKLYRWQRGTLSADDQRLADAVLRQSFQGEGVGQPDSQRKALAWWRWSYLSSDAYRTDTEDAELQACTTFLQERGVTLWSPVKRER